MPITKNKQKVRIQQFNGGEDSTGEEGLIQTPFATLARNVILDEPGKAIQREGLSRIGDNPDILKSHYTFDASSSEDDKGSNTGVDTSISYVDGKFGKAASFNGSTSLITIPANTTIDANSMVDFVIICWINPTSDGENDLGAIFDKIGATTAGYRAWVHSQSGSTVKLSFEVQHATTDAIVTTSTTIPTETATKLEFHSNADDSLDIYINGVKASYSVDTSGSGAKSDDSANDLILGNRAAVDRTFDGWIDDFRIYDGTRSADKYEMDKIQGLTRFKVGSIIDKIYRIRDVHLESLDTDFKGWTIENSGDGFTATADKDTNFVQADDKLFILNGVENVHSMDSAESITDEGAGAELGGGSSTDPPKGTIGAYAQNNRLFISGHLTQSLRDYVWFSNTLDTQTWNTTLGSGNFFRVQSGTGGKITSLLPFKLNELIIYKEDSIWVLDMTGSSPLSNWTLQPVNVLVGCKAGRTVQDIGNDQVFLDNEGFVRLLSRTSFDKIKTSVISGPVQDILDSINIDAMDKATSQLIDGRYYLSFPSGTNTENDVTLIWDSAAAQANEKPASGWSVLASGVWNVGHMTIHEFGDNKQSLVISDNRGISLVYQHTGNHDNGEVIVMEVAGPQHDGGSRGTDKIWGPLYVVADAGVASTITIFVEIDGGGFESLGTISLTGGAPVLPIALTFSLGGSAKAEALFHVKHIGRGKTCRIKIQHKQYNVNVTVNEYELHWEERIPRA